MTISWVSWNVISMTACKRTPQQNLAHSTQVYIEMYRIFWNKWGPVHVAPWFKVSCKSPRWRQVEPGSGRVGLFYRMGSAHTPICLKIALSCGFLQGSLHLGGAGKYMNIVHRGIHVMLIWLHQADVPLGEHNNFLQIIHSGFNKRFTWHPIYTM